MYHYGSSIADINEQKEVFQLAFNALESIPKSTDTTDRLFIYPISNEYTVNRVASSRWRSSLISLASRSSHCMAKNEVRV